MERVRDGDVGQLSELFERHSRRLFLYFYRVSGERGASEDLVQEVFLRILKYRHTWQSGQDFVAWMYRIARNTWNDVAGKRSAERSLDDEADRFGETIASVEGGPVEALMKAERLDLLRRALDKLPPDRRELLVLARFQELKYDQIAAILGCEVGTVKVRVFRAVRDLGRMYGQLTGERVL
ncbi:MAG TPA: RNA polymerase sigma factor [Solibacterales bacterium]|nr:RNA polymerase sigma factor [Bryobacterales bacterium]